MRIAEAGAEAADDVEDAANRNGGDVMARRGERRASLPGVRRWVVYLDGGGCGAGGAEAADDPDAVVVGGDGYFGARRGDGGEGDPAAGGVGG